MRERLRHATAGTHRALDSGLRYVLAEDLSPQRYARLLEALYGFHVPLEAALARLEGAAPELPLVRRKALLEADLCVLGVEPSGVALCREPPRLAGPDHLAGAVYVVEGACLGGQVIARAVRRNLGVTREFGAAFFGGEGARTAARWKKVLAWLEARARDGRAPQDIVEGACRTFAALAAWLSARGVLDGRD